MQSSMPAKAASRTLVLHAASGDAEFSGSLQGIFRSVGCWAATPEFNPETGGAIPEGEQFHLLVAGADGEHTARLLKSFAGVERLLVVRRTGAPLPDSASKRGLAIIDESPDLYRTFEAIAGFIGLSVHKELFISYSRKDSDAADALTAALLSQGRQPWVDRSDLQPSEEWRKALRQGIEDSDSFLFLTSQDSVSSPHCREELDSALELGKRIIPVLLDDLPMSELPTALASRQAIKAVDGIGTEGVVSQVVAALDRDARRVQLHRQILSRALKWKRTGDDPSLLLRGSELREGEDWLGVASVSGDPTPTEIQVAFITSSRSAARALQTKLWLVGAAVVVISCSLAIWALFSAARARREANNARRSHAVQSAFGAFVDWETDPVEAYLQADQAVHAVPDSDPLRETFDAMARNLALRMPELTTNLEIGPTSAAFSPDLSRIAFASLERGPQVTKLDGAKGAAVDLATIPGLTQFRQFKFNRAGTLVAGLFRPALDDSAPYMLRVWESASGREVGSCPLNLQDATSPPEIIGFTSRDEALLVESAASGGGYLAYRYLLKNLKDGPAGPAWRSRLRFLLGQVDQSISIMVQIRSNPRGVNKWLVETLDPATGRQSGRSLPLSEPVKEVFLSKGGEAMAVVTQAKEDGPSQVSTWLLTGGAPRQTGQTMSGEGPVFVWDVSRDGGALLVINSAADYSAELWWTALGKRVSIPVSRDVSSSFVMNAGEEYRVLNFTADDRFILAREPVGDPLRGSDTQQLLLFERDTLELVAAPFQLRLNYAEMRPADDTTRFATLSYDGFVEQWDLLRSRLPKPRSLPVPGLLLGATFLPDGATILTKSRIRTAEGYHAQLDLWDATQGSHIWKLRDPFNIRVEFCLNPTGTLLATASPSIQGKDLTEVKLWDLKSRKQVWEANRPSPVEAIAFRANGTIVSTAGRMEQEPPTVIDFETSSGEATELTPPPALGTDPVHLAFSPDGESLIADYSYSSVLIWSMSQNRALAEPLNFSEGVGLGFQLGYDILLNLQGIRPAGGDGLQGFVSGRVPVVIRPEGAGTTIVPSDGDAPILSALRRRNSFLYTVRGGDLVSQSGRWFTLGTNSTTVNQASAIRVYDLSSGFPVTSLLIHQVASRPGEPWPRLLSRRVAELDPVQALTYHEEEGSLLTLTTNGVLRRWEFRRNRSEKPMWDAPTEFSAALTGRRFVNNGYTQRIPQSEYELIRDRWRAWIQAFRTVDPEQPPHR